MSIFSVKYSFICLRLKLLYYRFFESHLVDLQSPVSVDLKKTKIKKVDEEKTLMLDTWTQTDLTLPPSLPPDVEAILSRFCVFKSQPEYKEDFNNSSGSRKKLLFRECFFSPDNKVNNCFLLFINYIVIILCYSP